MPGMPRWNAKANKIIRDLIGKPDNAVDDETPKQKKVKKQILWEEGQWTR